MPLTYVPIGNLTVSTNLGVSPTITFNSIPQGYTDLVMVMTGQTGAAVAADIGVCYFNGDTGSNYNYVQIGSNGSDSNAYSSFTRNFTGILAGNLPLGANGQWDFVCSTWNFMNYSNSTTFKNVMVRDASATTAGLPNATTVGVWRNTAAITSISMRTVNGYGFRAGTKFNLYGITRA
jgi:hypothetical protein